MTVADEELMAYVDAELDPVRSESLRREIESSPELARRVAAERVLRDRVRHAFDGVLREPIPSRLEEALSASPATVTPASARTWRPRSTWFAGLALAAGLALGIAIGPWIGRTSQAPSNPIASGSAFVAGGALADALSRQLASEQPASGPVHIGVSFLAKSGEYCRTFVSRDANGAMAGMACRQSVGWRIEAMQSVASTTAEPEAYRRAGTSLPPAILQAVESAMVGEPLDAVGEIKARGWDWTLPRVKN